MSEGNGFVETLVFNAENSKARVSNGNAELKAALRIPLNLATAISSSGVPCASHEEKSPEVDILVNLLTDKNKRVVSKDTLSTTLKIFNMVNGTSTDLPFADGALHDPLAQFPCLRRKRELILRCVPIRPDMLEVSQEQLFQEQERDLRRFYFGVIDADQNPTEA